MARWGGVVVAGALAIVALAGTGAAQADTVHGTVIVGTTKIVLASGMAVSYTAPNGPLMSILLSDKAADRQAFATDTKTSAGEPLVAGLFEGAWKSQHIGKRLSGFTFSFSDKGNMIGDEFLVGGRNNTFSLSSSEYVLELKSTSPRVAGRIRTRAAVVEAGSTTAGLDATFDLAVETVRAR